VLEARGISFAYRAGRRVLSDVTLAFAPGELAVVVGPNGAGKSTLLRLLLGALKPHAGKVEIDGRPVSAMAGFALASRLAYIAQRSTPAAPMTVRQTVALGRFALPGSPAAVDGAISALDLGHHEHELVERLSAGQQQRVALARVAAQMWPLGSAGGAARYVLADEPASNLDPLFLSRALSTLRSWARGGLGVVVVLHDLTAALRYADRVIVLGCDGRPVGDGPPGVALDPLLLERTFGVAFDHLSGLAGGPGAIVARDGG
jgi:iron complex transport system ATP-binding protein